MPDSVYITVTPAEKPRVRAFIDSPALQAFTRGSKWSGMTPPVMEDGLTYCEHRNCAGVNYTFGHDLACTFVLWLAKKLNKKFYWCDGDEKIQVDSSRQFVNSNWVPNKAEAPGWPASTFVKLRAENKAKNMRLARFVARLDRIWEKFNSEYQP